MKRASKKSYSSHCHYVLLFDWLNYVNSSQAKHILHPYLLCVCAQMNQSGCLLSHKIYLFRNSGSSSVYYNNILFFIQMVGDAWKCVAGIWLIILKWKKLHPVWRQIQRGLHATTAWRAERSQWCKKINPNEKRENVSFHR